MAVFVKQDVVAFAAHQNSEDVRVAGGIVAGDPGRKAWHGHAQRPGVGDQIDRQPAGLRARAAHAGGQKRVEPLEFGRVVAQRPFRTVTVDNEMLAFGAPPFGERGRRRHHDQHQGKQKTMDN
ncbi:hypothetical protein GMDG_08882 [Pseudogymnoascus destructans 20631-21]|uniref:Uncharacterized protein n=1 Tax=Pseudogymnoascus destructans (strain ATCC MYA-4855 / 20631-21) TaxID=658429 RepID=L8FQF4_PSED2|nr:hypothetical protein GMDG_08882 [Pseudogymnoascus destructans 20631-21]